MSNTTSKRFLAHWKIVSIISCILILSSISLPLSNLNTNQNNNVDNTKLSELISKENENNILGSNIKIDLEFPLEGVRFTKYYGFDLITIPECETLDLPGAPAIPFKPLSVVLPWDIQLKDLKVTAQAVEEIQLEGSYQLMAASEPRPLADESVLPSTTDSTQESLIEQDLNVYDSHSPYPATIIEPILENTYLSVKLAHFQVFPIQYWPSEQRLVLYTKICVELEFPEDAIAQKPIKNDIMYKSLESIVANYNDIDRFYDINTNSLFEDEGIYGPRTRNSGSPQPLNSMLTPKDVQYVIITNSTNFYSNFYPLAEWKTKKGVPAEIVDDGWIKNTYSANDTQEEIRDFIRDAKNTWGTQWVLIGGDVGVIPYRSAYAKVGSWPAEYDVAADLYYSDLDGNWDADGDSIYGERADNVNLYADVYVGRAPVETTTEVDNFVTKTLTYAKNPPNNYTLNATFAGEYLDSSTNSSLGLDDIKNNILPARYISTSLYDAAYQVPGSLNKTNFRSSINDGSGLIFHSAHSNYNVMGLGSPSGSQYAWRNADALALTNGNKLGVLYTLGCITTRFNMNECIAEDHVKNANGGTVAFIGNSRYGWYSPGNPGNGPSDRYMKRMATEIFANGNVKVGENFAIGKNYYVPWSNNDNSYRWLQYALNLLGDPEMYTWTDLPKTLSVTHPTQLYFGPQTVTVQVNDSVTDAPIPDALVCIQGEDVYKYGLTDANGRIQLQIQPQINKPVNFTVTKHNYYPYENNVTNIVNDVNPPLMFIGTGEYGWYNADPGAVLDVSFDSGGETDLSKAEYSTSPSGPWHVIFDTPQPVFNELWDISSIWSNLPEGFNKVCIRCNDSANPNHWVMGNITIKKDTISPLVTVNKAEYGWFTADPMEVIDVDFSNGSSISIGSPLQNAEYSVNSPTGPWYTIFNSPFEEYNNEWSVSWGKLDDGANTIYIKLYDEAGNEDNTTDSVTVKRDTLPPQVIIRKASYGWYSTNPGPVIDIDFSNGGNGSLVDYAEYKIGTSGTWETIFTTNTSFYLTNWAVIWDDLAEGSNTVYIRCFDQVGFEDATSDSFIIMKDTTAPVIQINKNVYGWHTTDPGNIIDVDFSYGNPSNSPLHYAQYRVHTDPAIGLIRPWRIIFISNVNEYITNWVVDWNDLLQGNNTIEVRVFDVGGNMNVTANSIYFLKDIEPPVITVNTGKYGWFNSDPGSIIDVDFSNNDNGSNLAFAEYRINDGLWHKICDIDDSKYLLNWSVAWAELVEGENNVEVRVWDYAGFYDSKNITIYKDTVDPTIIANEIEYGWYRTDPGAVLDVDFLKADDCSDLDFAEYKIGKSGVWNSIFVSNISSYIDPWAVNWLSLNEGINEIYLRTCDLAGNELESSITIKIKKDTIVPSLTINKQIYGWYSLDPGDVIDVDFSHLPSNNNGSNDPVDNSKLTLAQYRISNSGPWQNIFTDDLETFSDNWNVSWLYLEEGENIIYIRLYDAAGNLLFEPTQTLRIKKDTHPPKAIFNQDEYGWYNADPGPVIDVDFDAGYKDNSPLAKAQYKIGDQGSWVDIYNNSEDYNNYYYDDWSVAWDLAEEGVNNVFIRVRDQAGNEIDFINDMYFKKDTIGPEPPQLLSPTDDVKTVDPTPAHFWFEPTDPGSNVITEYYIEVDSSETFDSPLVSTTTSWISFTHQTDLDLGRYYWRVRAVDVAGNIGDWSTVWSFHVVTASSPQANLPPTAAAGEDIVVYAGEKVTFNGEGSSDPEDDPLVYLWDVDGDSEPELQGANVYWYFELSGKYYVTLEVFDTAGGCDSDTLLVTVLDTEIDSDDDGMSDDWEIYYGLDPDDPRDAMDDSDNDGFLNTMEYAEGSAPKDTHSTPITSNDRTPPKISHTKVTKSQQLVAIKITATVVDEDSTIQAVNLYYKKQTDLKYNSIPMGNTNPYSATIPGSMVTMDDLEYYIEAIDSARTPNSAYYGEDGQVESRPAQNSDIDIDVKETIDSAEDTDMFEEIQDTFGIVSFEACLIVLVLIVILLVIFGMAMRNVVEAKQTAKQHEARKIIYVTRGRNMVWEGDEFERINETEDLNLIEDDFALDEV